MRRKLHPLHFAFLFACLAANGQGTFIYDQQSSTDETPLGGNATIQQVAKPFGQSFIPALTSIEFVKLQFADPNSGNGLGATLLVNLRASSISGTVLSSTTPVFMPDGFVGIANFVFPAPVALSSGATYFFEPIVQAGDLWNINGGELNYPGGSVYFGGAPQVASDLWFREGIVVPEPGTWALFLVGVGALACRRRLMRSREG